MFEIERYTTPDLPMIESFIAALHDAERQLIPILSPGAELAAAEVRRMLDEISDDKGLALVAKSEGLAIGFGCVLFDDYRDPSYCEAHRRRAYLSYLYVAAPCRRRGIARALLAYMETEAIRRGCSRFVTRFKTVNTAARCCYEAAGFQPDQSIVSKPIGGVDAA